MLQSNNADVLPFLLRDGDRVVYHYRLDVEAASRQRWLYFPDMDTNDEVLLFIAYDFSTSDSSFTAKSVFPSLFRGAVLAPPEKPAGQSINIRILAG